jgi:hypothetical protein
MIFQIHLNGQTSKLAKGIFPTFKNLDKFWDDIFDQEEQLLLLVKLQNRNIF